jgi:hypothetical protein
MAGPMEIGRCPACDQPYTARDVAGLGILRARPARDGGPVVEYRCARCDRTIALVPHGEGRYAPPGAPIPEPVPAEQRVPPWVDRVPSSAAHEARTPPRHAGPEEPARPSASAPPPRRERVEPPPRAAPAPTPGDGPMTLVEALEVLGVSPAADRDAIERAYRDRSVQCHPDKVAHLDAEFQALAERKFRRLRAAYDLLMG